MVRFRCGVHAAVISHTAAAILSGVAVKHLSPKPAARGADAVTLARHGREGKDAALFVPSGTMGNQLALRLLAPPGSWVLAGARQHVVIYEAGAGALNAGVQFHELADDDGTLDPRDIATAVAAADYHQPAVGAVCVENTHMPADGAPWSLDALDAVVAAAPGVPIHMDGARLFHAEVATGVAASQYAGRATTVTRAKSRRAADGVAAIPNRRRRSSNNPGVRSNSPRRDSERWYS